MVKKVQPTEIIVILDRSGSMSGLETDTIGGFNTFLETQKALEGEAFLTLVLFDDKYDMLYEKKKIQDVPLLTSKEYYPRGSTALLDAVGKTINTFIPKTKKANVIVVITTDGYENSSKEYNNADIKKLVETKKALGNWEFLFLGANIDAFAEGSTYGFSATGTSTYTASPIGTQSVFAAVTTAVSTYRSTGEVDENWSKDVQ